MGADLGPSYELAKRLSTLEDLVRNLSTRDVLQNASIGAGGITVTNGGSIVITGTGSIVVSGGLTSGGTVTATTTITAGGAVSGASLAASGAITGATLAVSNSIDAVTTIHSAGRGTFDGGVTSADVRARTVTVGYSAVYADSSGIFGANTSSVHVKQDIETANAAAEVAALLRVALVRFRYIAAVDELGEAAPSELGSIVEYFATVPALKDYVFNGADGKPQGIRWEKISIPLIAVAQHHEARANAAEARLEAIERRLAAARIA
jgi:hypothetical protein